MYTDLSGPGRYYTQTQGLSPAVIAQRQRELVRYAATGGRSPTTLARQAAKKAGKTQPGFHFTPFKPAVPFVTPSYHPAMPSDTGGSVSTPAISPATGGGPSTGGTQTVTTPSGGEVEVGTIDGSSVVPSKFNPMVLLAIAGAAYLLFKRK